MWKGYKKQLIITVLFILLISNTSYGKDFSDVNMNNWYYNSVSSLVEIGAINGYEDGTFRPNKEISLAEFLKISLSSINKHEYPRLSGGHWATGVYNEAVSKGIINPYDDKFKGNGRTLDSPINREDMALIVVNISKNIQGKKNIDTTGVNNIIKDYNIISKSRQEAVKEAYKQGLIVGKDIGFDPKAKVTRAEASEIIIRMLNNEDKLANPNINTSKAIEKEVIRLINIERQKHKLSSLDYDPKLAEIAKIKSQDMADNNYFSHNSPSYGSPFNMIERFGVNYKFAGENLAKGYVDVEAVVNGWMNSPGHKENILNENFRKIGVGYVNLNGESYWTQIFTD